jgi:hypothetical protein
MTATNPHYEYHDEEVDPPADASPGSPMMRGHWWSKSTCPCGWESNPRRTWGQSVRAWTKHVAEAQAS